MAAQPPTFSSYEDFKRYFDDIDPIDEYGFLKKPRTYIETPEQEIERLQTNLAFYREYMKNRSTFPPLVHTQRKFDFDRLRELRPGESPPLNDAHMAQLRGMSLDEYRQRKKRFEGM